MAEKRKLLNEMEKCFKKIDEGVEIFEEIMNKMNEASSDNQRDKLQDDLKKEIKKLQRLREQIKGWQNHSDIKDKEKLNQYRKLIEQRMETFKDVERENKTKPHSKQGLSAEEKLDPREREKADTVEWLNSRIRKIQDEIDRTESKIESCSTVETSKKRGKKDDKKIDKEKIEELKRHLERVQFHLQNLEVCLRLITNEKIDIKEVNTKLKEPLDMYIEALEPDSEEDPANLEPDDIYEELGLGNYISELGVTTTHSLDDEKSDLIGQKSPSGSPTNDETKARHISGEPLKTTRSKSITSNSATSGVPSTPTTPGAHVRMTRQTSGENSSSVSSPPPQTPPAQPVSYTSIVAGRPKPVVTAPTTPLTTPAQNYVAATSAPTITRPAAANPQPSVASYAAAVAPNQQRATVAPTQSAPPPPQQQPPTQQPPAPTPITPLTMPPTNIPPPPISSTTPETGASVPQTPAAVVASSMVSPPLSVGNVNSPLASSSVTPPTYATVVAAGSGMTPPPTAIVDISNKPRSEGGKPEEKPPTSQHSNMDELSAAIGMSSEQLRGLVVVDEPTAPKTPQTTTIHPWLGAIPLGEITPNDEMQANLRTIDAVCQRAHLDDLNKFRPLMPRMPCQTAAHYPQKTSSNFETLEYYTRLLPETLFFIFYFMEGTKAQMLAAKALKKLAWRYHFKHLMWYQRAEEPKQITDDYELGTYVYFDYEKWTKRKRENFTFEYKYLEDKDVD